MNNTETKQKLLDQLYEPYKQCLLCPLAKQGRTNVVFGEGNVNSHLMFIGEGPGREENEQGKPFVGRSGKLLTRLLTIVGIDRQDVFITNIVKCRPPGNRRPTFEESSTCKKILLLKQIEIINPKIICTLGSCAVENIIEKQVAISKIRGTCLPWNNRIIIPTFHPAYALRNPRVIETMVEDILNAKRKSEI
ncbi:uracil-DNA glycosylase [Candidatus Dependentiae bacterium]|nr:MAG: uracil-DNA glycosylase [Candidatus Dependentiae bacterium]